MCTCDVPYTYCGPILSLFLWAYPVTVFVGFFPTQGGYPVFLSNVYMIDAPSWLRGHMKQYDSFRSLQSNGKVCKSTR